MRECRNRRAVLLAALGLVVLAAVGCRDDGVSAPDQARAQGASRAAPDGRFTAEVRPSTIAVGEPTEVTFVLRAGEGLKTNREFPSWSLDLTAPSGIKLADESFSRQAITLADREATLTTELTASQAGSVAIDGVANFSVCNDQTCHILRDESVRFSVEAD